MSAYGEQGPGVVIPLPPEPKIETCEYCDEEVDQCSCDDCSECGEQMDHCMCDYTCAECNEILEECTCDAD